MPNPKPSSKKPRAPRSKAAAGARSKPAPSAAAATDKNPSVAYELQVTLLDIHPPVWRRLQVPGDATLDWLHAALQVAMGWTNSHLHQFMVGRTIYAPPAEDDFLDVPSDIEQRNEADFTLQRVVPEAGAVLRYQYDFGDSWEHEIVVEKLLPLNPQRKGKAVCLGGSRACPPEDCGGVPGYENFLTVIGDPDHPDHDHLVHWIGGAFDPEAFSPKKATLWLAQLKWPHTTEAQLRRVLMGRDGVAGR